MSNRGFHVPSQESAVDPSGQRKDQLHRMAQRVVGVILASTLVSGCHSAESDPTTPTASIAAQPSTPRDIPHYDSNPEQQQPVNKLPRTGKHPMELQSPGMVAYNNVLQYVGGSQEVNARGATVRFDQANPYVEPSANGHSLIELAVESDDGQQIVEVGWTVDTSVDDRPDLFTFHWVNGQDTCYDECGFVQTSHDIRPGDAVQPGKVGSYGLTHSDAKHEWDVLYNNETIGYYPDSLWNGIFTRSGLIQVFGEVASKDTYTCTDMGNGSYGDGHGATRISNFSVVGADTPANLQPYETNPQHYTYGHPTHTGMLIGGAGAC